MRGLPNKNLNPLRARNRVKISLLGPLHIAPGRYGTVSLFEAELPP